MNLNRPRSEATLRVEAAAAGVRRFTRYRMYAALAVLVLVLAGFGLWRTMTVRTIGAPFGGSVRTPDAVATLIRTQEPYVPSLHRNPDRDRFRIDLMLTPLVGDASPRRIGLARDLTANAFHPGTKILGLDGPLLWMLVPELRAVDLRSSRVITGRDLSTRNPELGDVWATARFHFTDRLHLLSPDRRYHYVIDAESLRAIPDDNPPRLAGLESAPTAATMLCLGGRTGEVEFLGVLAPKEREASFRVGTHLPASLPAERTREPRTLHRVRVEPSGSRLRITAVEAVSDRSFADAAFVRASASDGPLLIGDPAGFLMLHREGTILAPHMHLTRVSMDGTPGWTLGTGLKDLQQILPHPTRPVLVGTLPAPEGRVPEPVLVIVDADAGTATTRTLRP